MGYLYLAVALIFNATANILLKLAAQHFMPGPILQLGNLNWQLILGIALFACNVLLYTLALRALPLSVAYPIMVAGGFLIVNSFALIALREPITALEIFGYIVIVAGLSLVVYASGT